MDKDVFIGLVREAIEELPEDFRRRLENVEFIVMDEPSEDVLGPLKDKVEVGIVLGLYRGVPLPRRGISYGMTLPDQIIFFQRSIEQVAGCEERIPQVVREVVRHEIAHYFGFTDEQIERILKEKKGSND